MQSGTPDGGNMTCLCNPYAEPDAPRASNCPIHEVDNKGERFVQSGTVTMSIAVSYRGAISLDLKMAIVSLQFGPGTENPTAQLQVQSAVNNRLEILLGPVEAKWDADSAEVPAMPENKAYLALIKQIDLAYIGLFAGSPGSLGTPKSTTEMLKQIVDEAFHARG